MKTTFACKLWCWLITSLSSLILQYRLLPINCGQTAAPFYVSTYIIRCLLLKITTKVHSSWFNCLLAWAIIIRNGWYLTL
jgi:hypothetical protein